MKLLIVESPTKAKNISQYLGDEYYVLSSYGHVRAIPSKVGAVRPEDDFYIEYEAIKKSEKHVKQILQEAKKSSVVYLATDPDREGESISWHIASLISNIRGVKQLDVKRIFFHEITKKSVLEAVNTPRAIDMGLVHAQQARQALDYLVGFNISPVLWKKLPGSKSAGRVQSIALKLVCAQEDLIREFEKKEYWNINIKLEYDLKSGGPTQSFTAQLFQYLNDKLDKYDIPNEERANEIVESIAKEKKYIVQKIQKKVAKRSPYPPFHTSSLLQEASQKLNFSATKTMQVAQKLYEGIKINDAIIGLITYMRTDSFNISAEVAFKTKDFIEATYGPEYALPSPRFFKTKAKNAQEAHEAIRPTDVFIIPDKIRSFLSVDEFKLYDMVWRRFIACQMKEAKIENTSILLLQSNNSGTLLRISGFIVLFDGFQQVYYDFRHYRSSSDISEDDVDESHVNQVLPNFSEGDLLYLSDVVPSRHFTKPPPRYNEASLIKKLESLGIGRPSTYSTIINTILNRNYVVKQNKALIPENKGELVNAFLCRFFEKYVEYGFTAKLEDKLDQIANHRKGYKDVLRDFWEDFKVNVDSVITMKTRDILDELEKVFAQRFFSDSTCPSCAVGAVKLKNGRFGSFFACSAFPDCKYTLNFSSNSTMSIDVDIQNKNQYPITLGIDDNGNVISLHNGPYGFYVQSSYQEKSLKRVSVPKKLPISDVTYEKALYLLSIPYVVCKDDNGVDVTVNLGKYGAYVKYGGENYRIKDDVDIFTIDADKALSIVKSGKKRRGAASKRKKKKE